MSQPKGPQPTPTLQLTFRLAVLNSTDHRASLIAAAQITAITALITAGTTEVSS